MRTSELAMTISAMVRNIEDTVEVAVKSVESQYQPTGLSNAKTDEAVDIHAQMARLLFNSSLKSIFNKRDEELKAALDEACIKFGLNPEGVAGETKIIVDNGSLVYTKKQNKDSDQVALKDVITELRIKGVDKKLIDDAVEAATKPKKGNTYYIITGAEDV